MQTGHTRRSFFGNLARTVAGRAAAFAAGKASGRAERGDLGILRPPGWTGEESAWASCQSCARCAEVCETGCIKYLGPEAGISRGTPYLLPAEKGCNLCLRCAPACPSGALETKAGARMGIAEIDESLCVSFNGMGICGACHTICPLRNKALVQSYRDQPRVNAEDCVGCGLCEEVCITGERKAIRVRARSFGQGDAA